MDDKFFENGTSGKKSLRVFLINPPTGDNPTRTKKDYEEDQKEARERHEILQGQYKIILKSYRINIIMVIITIISGVAAVAASIAAWVAVSR